MTTELTSLNYLELRHAMRKKMCAIIKWIHNLYMLRSIRSGIKNRDEDYRRKISFLTTLLEIKSTLSIADDCV